MIRVLEENEIEELVPQGQTMIDGSAPRIWRAANDSRADAPAEEVDKERSLVAKDPWYKSDAILRRICARQLKDQKAHVAVGQ